MKNHDVIRHMLSEYIEGSVSPLEREEIKGHVASCPECSTALDELKKTIEHIRTVEELEPPAWLSQKIMAKVREEAESRRGILQKLFYPLHIKLPIEAVAVAFLAVTTFYIYQGIQPEMKTAEAPTEGFVSKQDAASLLKEAPSSSIAEREAPKRSQKFKDEAAQPEVMTAAPPAPIEKKAEPDAAQSVGLTAAIEESQQRAPASRRSKAHRMADTYEDGISLIVRVKDIETAAKEVENLVARLSGKIIRTEFGAVKKVFVVQINFDKLHDLIAKLKLVGNVEGRDKAGAVKEKEGPSATQGGAIETRTEVIKISIQK